MGSSWDGQPRPRTDLERALARRLVRLVGDVRWPDRRRITANERRWIAEFLTELRGGTGR